MLGLVLDVYTRQRLHFLVLHVALVLVRVQLLAQKHKPVVFQKTAFLLFFKNLTLQMDTIFTLAGLAAFLADVARITADAVVHIVQLGRRGLH